MLLKKFLSLFLLNFMMKQKQKIEKMKKFILENIEKIYKKQKMKLINFLKKQKVNGNMIFLKKQTR